MKRIYPWLVVLAGIAGAILRGAQLCYGYNDAGLPEDGYLALPVLTVVVLIACAVLSRMFGEKQEFEPLFQACMLQRLAGIVLGALMIVVGVLGLIDAPDQLAAEISEYYEIQPGIFVTTAIYAQWILCGVAGVAIIVLAAGQNGKPRGSGYAACTVLPMFWAGLTMVMIYHTNSGNPVQSAYLYELLLCVALMAAFYGIAGFFYADRSPARFMMYGGMAVYLGLTAIGGRLYDYVCSGGTSGQVYQQAALGLGVLFLIPVLFSVSDRMSQRQEE
ncbi:MAG: hypothetical protein ACI4PQ_01830 [Butyricicoccaceae bacterium]